MIHRPEKSTQTARSAHRAAPGAGLVPRWRLALCPGSRLAAGQSGRTVHRPHRWAPSVEASSRPSPLGSADLPLEDTRVTQLQLTRLFEVVVGVRPAPTLAAASRRSGCW